MISYTDTAAGMTPGRLEGFFVGWSNPPSPDTHLRILRGSTHVILALDDRSGQCVGFVTAISDGVLSAYIPLLEVLPSHQKQGIGSELMRRMLAEVQGLYMIDLLCDAQTQPFYERLGMRCMSAMMIRDFARQSGLAST